MCVSSAHEAWTRVLDPLEVELRTLVSCHVGTGNGTQTSVRVASALDHWAFQTPSEIILTIDLEINFGQPKYSSET
jgi:predicted sugar kinase